MLPHPRRPNGPTLPSMRPPAPPPPHWHYHHHHSSPGTVESLHVSCRRRSAIGRPAGPTTPPLHTLKWQNTCQYHTFWPCSLNQSPYNIFMHLFSTCRIRRLCWIFLHNTSFFSIPQGFPSFSTRVPSESSYLDCFLTCVQLRDWRHRSTKMATKSHLPNGEISGISDRDFLQ